MTKTFLHDRGIAGLLISVQPLAEEFKPMHTQSFRIAVIMHLLALIAVWLAPFLPVNLDSDTEALLTWDGYNALVLPNALAYWAPLLAWFVVSIGLLGFWKFSREALLILTAITIALSFAYGTRVFLAVDMFLMQVSLVLNGIVVGASLSPKFYHRINHGKADSATELRSTRRD